MTKPIAQSARKRYMHGNYSKENLDNDYILEKVQGVEPLFGVPPEISLEYNPITGDSIFRETPGHNIYNPFTGKPINVVTREAFDTTSDEWKILNRRWNTAKDVSEFMRKSRRRLVPKNKFGNKIRFAEEGIDTQTINFDVTVDPRVQAARDANAYHAQMADNYFLQAKDSPGSGAWDYLKGIGHWLYSQPRLLGQDPQTVHLIKNEAPFFGTNNPLLNAVTKLVKFGSKNDPSRSNLVRNNSLPRLVDKVERYVKFDRPSTLKLNRPKVNDGVKPQWEPVTNKAEREIQDLERSYREAQRKLENREGIYNWLDRLALENIVRNLKSKLDKLKSLLERTQRARKLYDGLSKKTQRNFDKYLENGESSLETITNEELLELNRLSRFKFKPDEIGPEAVSLPSDKSRLLESIDDIDYVL